MSDPSFWGKTANEWEAIATVAAAIVSLFNTLIVAAVAVFTFKYMRSTKELVTISKLQSDASIRQADASIKTLEILNIERTETESFQRAVFIHSIGSVNSTLLHYRVMMLASAKPWRERDCYLIPSEWGICRAFISRVAPELLDEVLRMEIELNNLCEWIQGFIKGPDSHWLSNGQRRKDISDRAEMVRKQVEAFSGNALKSRSS